MDIDWNKEFRGLIKYLKSTNRKEVELKKIISYMNNHGYTYDDYNNIKGMEFLTFDLERSPYYIIINKDSIHVTYTAFLDIFDKCIWKRDLKFYQKLYDRIKYIGSIIKEFLLPIIIIIILLYMYSL